MKSIGYLVNTYPRSSTTFVRREINALERLGWTVHRFAMRPEDAPLVDPLDIAEAGKTEYVLKQGIASLLPMAIGWMVGRPAKALGAVKLAMQCGARGAGGAPGTGGRVRHLIYLIEAAFVARRCTELGIRHVHAHFGTNSATVAMLASALEGPSYSFTTHGPEEFDAPRALSLDLKLQRAAFAVAISSFGKSQLSRWIEPALWHKLEVVHCGIETWRFAEPRPMPTGQARLVAIGRLSEQKGFALLLEALAIAIRAAPDLHVELVGDGPLRGALTAQAASHGLTGNLTFSGWKTESGVRDSLAAAHALILPSFAEGLPMVIMEAFAAARPAIATSIAGVPELVTQDTGWLVPAGDPVELAAAMVRLAATTLDDLAKRGAAARDRVLARHDIDIEAAKLDALFAPLTAN